MSCTCCKGKICWQSCGLNTTLYWTDDDTGLDTDSEPLIQTFDTADVGILHKLRVLVRNWHETWEEGKHRRQTRWFMNPYRLKQWIDPSIYFVIMAQRDFLWPKDVLLLLTFFLHWLNCKGKETHPWSGLSLWLCWFPFVLCHKGLKKRCFCFFFINLKTNPQK